MGFPTATMNSFLDAQITGTLYAALMTTKPTDDGVGGVECSEAWYSRVASSNWPSAASKIKTNGEELDYGDPTTDVTIVAVVLYDAPTGGNQIAVSNDFSKAIVAAADKVSIKVGELTFTAGA